jgi:hypothetical protein
VSIKIAFGCSSASPHLSKLGRALRAAAVREPRAFVDVARVIGAVLNTHFVVLYGMLIESISMAQCVAKKKEPNLLVVQAGLRCINLAERVQRNWNITSVDIDRNTFVVVLQTRTNYKQKESVKILQIILLTNLPTN